MAAVDDDLVNNANLEANLEAWDGLFDDAVRQWKAQSNNRAFGDFPDGFLDEYQSDGEKLIAAQRTFNAEWAKCVVKKGDRKKLNRAFVDYSQSLQLVLAGNARYKAVIDLKLAATCAGFLAITDGFARFFLQRNLDRTLGTLVTDLQTAQRDVSFKEAKREIDAMLSIVLDSIKTVRALATLAKVSAGIALHTLLDVIAGTTSVKSSVNTVVGDGNDAIDKLDELHKGFLTAASALFSWMSDTQDLDEAKETLDRVRTSVTKALEEYEDFYSGALKYRPGLKKLDDGLKECIDNVKGALKTRARTGAQYDNVKKAIANALK